MADTVSSQTIVDGSKYVVMKFTSVSDGTGESAVTKVDVSALTPAATTVTIEQIWYTVTGMVATLLWDATTDVRILDLSGYGEMCFDNFGGLPNNAGTGITGDILLTTTGHSSGDSYSIIIKMRKT